MTIKIGKQYRGWLVVRDGAVYRSKKNAESHSLRKHAPLGWQRHGPGYWLIGAVAPVWAWLDEFGGRHTKQRTV